IIPPGLDTVMVGDIERTRLKDTKRIIFFMGVNDGIIPKAGQAGGIITDTDREFLEKNNYILAPTATDNVFKLEILFVHNICQAYGEDVHYFQQVGFRRGNKKKVLYNKYFNESF
ncbi:ATP-dependent nuclease subunit B, partial [human gut metagenome]